MNETPNWLDFFEDRERRYAAFYLDYARRRARRDPAAYEQLEAEIGNLLKTATWLAGHDEAEGILALATALWSKSDFLRSRGYIQRGLPLLEQARRAAQEQGDVAAQCVWLEAIGHVHILNGSPALAQPLYEQALLLAEMCETQIFEAKVRLGLGRLLTDIGRVDDAVIQLEQSLQLYRNLIDYEGEIEALTILTNALSLQGDFESAVSYLEQGLPTTQLRQDRQGEAEVRYALGYNAALAEDWSQAIIHFEVATDIAKEIGDRFHEVRGLSALGEAWLAQGDAQKSLTVLLEALARQETIDDLITKTLTHFYLAKVYRALHHFDDCLHQLEQVHPFRQVPILATLAAEAEWIKAEIYLERGNIKLAKNALGEVLNLASEAAGLIGNQAKQLLEELQNNHEIIPANAVECF